MLWQRIVLEDEASLGEIHASLSMLACASLQWGTGNRQIQQSPCFYRRATVRSIRARLSNCAEFRIRMLTKGDDVVASDDVLAVGRTKNCSADGFSLPVLSPMKMITLLTPSTGVFRIACTCQIRLSSKSQLACRKALTVSLVGVAAVKLAGSGLGNTGAADGAGAAGPVRTGPARTEPAQARRHILLRYGLQDGQRQSNQRHGAGKTGRQTNQAVSP